MKDKHAALGRGAGDRIANGATNEAHQIAISIHDTIDERFPSCTGRIGIVGKIQATRDQI